MTHYCWQYSLCKTSFEGSSGLSRRPCGVLAFFSGCLSPGVPLTARTHPAGVTIIDRSSAAGWLEGLLPWWAAGVLLHSSSSSLLAETQHREGTNIFTLLLKSNQESNRKPSTRFTCAPRTFTQPLCRCFQRASAGDVISVRPAAFSPCSFMLSRQEATKYLFWANVQLNQRHKNKKNKKKLSHCVLCVY